MVENWFRDGVVLALVRPAIDPPANCQCSPPQEWVIEYLPILGTWMRRNVFVSRSYRVHTIGM